MALALVFKHQKPLVNAILGVNVYYQNQKFLHPEIGVSLGLLVTFVTIGIRLENKELLHG